MKLFFLPNRTKTYTKSICVAAGLFILDAFGLNQGFLALCLMLVSVLVLLPRALWALRENRRPAEQRLVKTGIYLLTAVAIIACNSLQNRMADRQAIKIGNACLAFHAKYQRYPEDLNELVPAFLPSVPVAKYSLMGNAVFFYSSPIVGREPMLYYQVIPPFGRRFYHMETGTWGYLD